jgi:hypothetical protein
MSTSTTDTLNTFTILHYLPRCGAKIENSSLNIGFASFLAKPIS